MIWGRCALKRKIKIKKIMHMYLAQNCIHYFSFITIDVETIIYSPIFEMITYKIVKQIKS